MPAAPLLCVLYGIPQELSTLLFNTGLFIGLDLTEAGLTDQQPKDLPVSTSPRRGQDLTPKVKFLLGYRPSEEWLTSGALASMPKGPGLDQQYYYVTQNKHSKL